MKAHSNNAKESDIAQYCKDFYNQIKEEQHNVKQQESSQACVEANPIQDSTKEQAQTINLNTQGGNNETNTKGINLKKCEVIGNAYAYMPKIRIHTKD